MGFPAPPRRLKFGLCSATTLNGTAVLGYFGVPTSGELYGLPRFPTTNLAIGNDIFAKAAIDVGGL